MALTTATARRWNRHALLKRQHKRLGFLIGGTHETLVRLLSSNTRQQEREAERQAKRSRRKAMEEKRAQMNAFLQAKHEEQRKDLLNNPKEEKSKSEQEQTIAAEEELKQRHEHERSVLLTEAASLSKSLYRTCLRCVKLMRPGNEFDEKEFRERQAKQIEEMEEALKNNNRDFFIMSPPVDRENELSSRAAYYYQFTREGFEQESDCLSHNNPWKEQDVERYLHFLREGEHRRQWILKDYKFQDPYPDTFDEDRVVRFENRARELLRSSYQMNGWPLGDSTHEKDQASPNF